MSDRKNEELKAKIGSIGADLAFWRKESAATKKWEKHHSQIARVATQIEVAAAKLSAELQTAAAGGTVLDEARKLERLVIDLHAVWDFFRAKLVPRGVDELASYLIVADEFAWACYQPFLERVDPLHREPPLTFFQVDTSPFALPRNHSYQSSAGDRLRSDTAIAMLKSLPIPVIAIPWFQSHHLPDLLIVAHEAGHHVEELGLTADLLAAMDGVPNQGSWKSWSGEVFADVFSTLVCGPAYTTALIDFLATAPATIATERKTAGEYPTAYLRILMSVAALKHRQFTTEAEKLEQVWRGMFPTHAMTAWESDCPTVAAAILERSYLGFKLSDLLAFTKDNQKHAVSAAGQALDAQVVNAAPDVRELVAASALAFAKDPAQFHRKAGTQTPQERLIEQIVKNRTSGTRSGANEDGPRFAAGAEPRDKAGGAALFDMLMRFAKE